MKKQIKRSKFIPAKALIPLCSASWPLFLTLFHVFNSLSAQFYSVTKCMMKKLACLCGSSNKMEYVRYKFLYVPISL